MEVTCILHDVKYIVSYVIYYKLTTRRFATAASLRSPTCFTLSKKSKLIGDFRLTSCSPEGLENDQSKSTSSHSSISCFVLAPIIFPDYIILFCDNRIALNFRFRF